MVSEWHFGRTFGIFLLAFAEKREQVASSLAQMLISKNLSGVAFNAFKTIS
jgi:hypothetical protein